MFDRLPVALPQWLRHRRGWALGQSDWWTARVALGPWRRGRQGSAWLYCSGVAGLWWGGLAGLLFSFCRVWRYGLWWIAGNVK